MPGGNESPAPSFGRFRGVLEAVAVAGTSISASGCEPDMFKVEEGVENASETL